MRRKVGRGGVVKSRRAISRGKGANRVSDRSAYRVKLNLDVFIALAIFVTLLLERRLDACLPKVIDGRGECIRCVVIRIRYVLLIGSGTR